MKQNLLLLLVALTAVLSKAMAIPVTMNTTGGSSTLTQVEVVLDKSNFYTLSGYLPTRAGFTFDGYYDANNRKVWDAQGMAVEGNYWTSDNKWKANVASLTVLAHWRDAAGLAAIEIRTGENGGSPQLSHASLNNSGSAAVTYSDTYETTRYNYNIDLAGSTANYHYAYLLFDYQMDVPAYSRLRTTLNDTYVHQYNFAYASQAVESATAIYLFETESAARNTLLVSSPSSTTPTAPSGAQLLVYAYNAGGQQAVGSAPTKEVICFDNSKGDNPQTMKKYGMMTVCTKTGARSQRGYLLINKKNDAYYTAQYDYYKYITYNANGGAGEMDVQTVENSGTVAANGFTRTKVYDFLGWNTAADGSGTAYAPGDAITATADDKGEMTLYAQWKNTSSPLIYTAAEKLPETEYMGGEGAILTTSFNAPIASHTFEDGVGVITFEDELTVIRYSAFRKCAITSLTIPETVDSIYTMAICYCTDITSLKVAPANTTYDSRNNCNAIIETASNTLILACDNTVIPEDVTSIGAKAFADCTKMTSITIPSNVTRLGEGAFYDCWNLTSIICEAETPPVCADILCFQFNHLIPLYVPYSSIEAYKAAHVWKEFRNIHAIPGTAPDLTPSFSNIKTWIGSGEKQIGVVIDFNDESADHCSFAWGYRWDGGTRSVERVMKEIAAADARLTLTITYNEQGDVMENIAYDHDDNPATADLVGALSVYRDEDEDLVYESGNAWYLLANEGETYKNNEAMETENGMTQTQAKSGNWICWRLCTYSKTYSKPSLAIQDSYVDPTTWYDAVQAWAISGLYIQPAVALTPIVIPEGAILMSVTADGEVVETLEDVYTVPESSNVVVTFAAQSGYTLAVTEATLVNATPENHTVDLSAIQPVKDTATSLYNAAANMKVSKTLENGQLVIIRDGVRYNVQGAKL